ncbi:hypothetical protein Barb6XT_01540 [Bacteroidales bacterium Barb6XT]|nr:hypothetical protein Barb6XT_01540 [Bacteroidales bacterium Barb6XT]
MPLDKLAGKSNRIAGLPCLSQALFLESSKPNDLAGFLTYFVFETPFPSKQWIKYCSKTLAKLTAAGLFRIFT